jgi:hypothetical protein
MNYKSTQEKGWIYHWQSFAWRGGGGGGGGDGDV